jgi:hypothetical protein
LRFTIDNNRIAASVYVHPATHLAGPPAAPNMLPYGARLRLRADYPLAAAQRNARTVAKALQTYGMYLADGGNIYISATTDASDSDQQLDSDCAESRATSKWSTAARASTPPQDCKHVPITQ